ncbi:MAG TPA: (Fe-S)-binding protein [Chromatiales bacterium]|nr:(Fe-S)-binding protein [Thiotrichales bacterium]HIP67053.1 (Fe-S)-binding protein [Chromatiales bacterium]
MSKQLEIAVNEFSKHIDARIASYFSSCVNCGMCADACLFYQETGDPRYTPIYKLEPMRKIWKKEYTFWGKFSAKMGWSKPLTEKDLADWQSLVYDSCTLCKRCTMVCPVGNDIAYMIRKEREGMSAAGYAPDGLKDALERSVKIGSPMGVTFKALKAQIGYAEEETGIKINIDKVGADYLSVLSSMEVMGFAEVIGSMAKIFKQAGVSWTFSSECFEATNTGVQIGSSKDAAELAGRIVTAAEKLKVKYVISPECGHAYTALRWDAPNLLGRTLPFKVVHIVELLDQLRKDGLLKTEGMDLTPMSFHDPCSLVRKGGVIKEPRSLLKMVARDVREMRDHGEMNWCCGGGGGVSAIDEAAHLRYKSFRIKKKQLEETGAKKLVTACANCRITIMDGLEDYEMDDIEVVGITELVAEHLIE